MNKFGVCGLVLLGSCAAKGPYTMKRERVDGLMTRYENSEIVCYVSHGIEADDLTCKWKSESDANIRARKLIAQDLR